MFRSMKATGVVGRLLTSVRLFPGAQITSWFSSILGPTYSLHSAGREGLVPSSSCQHQGDVWTWVCCAFICRLSTTATLCTAPVLPTLGQNNPSFNTPRQ